MPRDAAPVVLFKEAAVLEGNGKITFVTGFLDELLLFVALYGATCAPTW